MKLIAPLTIIMGLVFWFIPLVYYYTVLKVLIGLVLYLIIVTLMNYNERNS